MPTEKRSNEASTIHTRTMAFERNFTRLEHLRYAAPRMAMSLLVMSYLVVDGLLISRTLGTTALSAISMAYPIVSLLMAFGVAVASGSGTVASRYLGTHDRENAQHMLATAVLANAAIGILLAALLYPNLEIIFALLKVTPEQAQFAEPYMRILLICAPLFLLGFVAQTFLLVAGLPKWALAVSALAGITNAGLDVLALLVLQSGIEGAAWATVASWTVNAVMSFFVLMRHPRGIRFTIREPLWPLLLSAFHCGAFEFVANCCGVVLLTLLNKAFLSAYGVDGVAALSVATFTLFVFNACYHGFCEASGPIAAFKAGAQDALGLRQTITNSITLLAALSFIAYGLALLTGDTIFRLFSEASPAVIQLLNEHFPGFALSLLFSGLNLYGAYALAALHRGRTAAGLTLIRTFALPVAFVLFAPRVMGNDCLWLALVAAEGLTFAVLFLGCIFAWRSISQSAFSCRAGA